MYQNKQLYSECQLVAVINAAIKLGQPSVKIGSNEYERLVDLVGARYGSAISVELAYTYLRLKFVDTKPEWSSVEMAVCKGLPLSLAIWSKHYGYHEISIVDKKHDNIRGGYLLKVPNLKRHTDTRMWIHWEDLQSLRGDKSLENVGHGYFRVFYINS